MNNLFGEMIEELSEKLDVDLFSFHTPYLLSRLEERIYDLALANPIDYLTNIISDDTEPELFYFEYLYGFRDSQLFRKAINLQKVLLDYIKATGNKDLKIWIPLSVDKITGMIISSLMEDLINDYIINSYTIYHTHPRKESILRLRNTSWKDDGSINIPSSWKENYWKELSPGTFELLAVIKSKSIFANHDFLKDNPIKSLDLIVLNGYFNVYSRFRKTNILRSLFESLKPSGLVLTSESNTTGEFLNLFETADSSFTANIYKKKNGLVPLQKQSSYSPFKYTSYVPSTMIEKTKQIFFEKLDIAYVILSDNMNLVEISPNLQSSLNLKEGTFSSKPEEIFPPDFVNIIIDTCKSPDRSPTREPGYFESQNPLFQGRFNRIFSHSFQSPDNTGKLFVIYFWNVDSSSEKDSVEKYERSIREIHHRVKNQMTIIFSLLDLEKSYIEKQETIELIQRMSNRVHAIEIIQNRMSESPFQLKVDLKSILQDFSTQINSLFLESAVSIPTEFIFDAENISLPSRLASPILLSLGEISTVFLRNILHHKDKKFVMEWFSTQRNDKIELALVLSCSELTMNGDSIDESQHDWLQPTALEKSILEANSRQIQSLLIVEESSVKLRYGLFLPLD